MASVKHAFTSAKSDGGDATLVRPSNWNDDHEGAISAVNVKTDAGATGDGTTDDGGAFATAETLAGVGGSIFVPKGVYRFVTAWNPTTRGLKVIGESKGGYGNTDGSTFKLGTNAMTMITYDSGVLQHVGPQFERINFWIPTGLTGTLLRINRTNRWNVRECFFQCADDPADATSTIGIRVQKTALDNDWWNVWGCHFRQLGSGIYSDEGVPGNVVACEFTSGAAAIGINVVKTGTLDVLACWFDIGRAFVQSGAACNHLRFMFNRIEAGTQTSPMIQLAETSDTEVSADIQIMGNTFVGTGGVDQDMVRIGGKASQVLLAENSKETGLGVLYDVDDAATGVVYSPGSVTFDPAIAPTALAADANNWAPPGITHASVVKIDASTAVSISGITGGVAATNWIGRVLTLANISANDVTLLHQSTSSTTGNRIICPNGASYVISPSASVLLWYDAAITRWRVIAAPAGAGAPTGADYLVGTAQGGLSAEIVVGTSPGGELGGTWATPTVDATHSGSAHHTRLHDIEGTSDHSLTGAAAGEFLRATGATTFAMEAIPFSVGAVFEGAPPSNGARRIWTAPYACTVTDIQALVIAGTNAVVNAQRNTVDLRSADATVTAGTDYASVGGTLQNQAFAVGDDLALEIVSISGAVTLVGIQVNFTRP